MTKPDSNAARGPTPLTLGVIFYNHAAFAEQAVRAALAQDYWPLEIVLSDDASSDETFAVIKRTVGSYEGPHHVIVNRNTTNLGLAGNVNRVMELATGEIILLAGGDDISMRDRAARSAEVLNAEGDCLCVSFGAIRFEGTETPTELETGLSSAWKRYTRDDYVSVPFFHLNGASRAFRRRAFDFFGPIAVECPTEDSVMLLRCVLLGDVLATRERQVYFRVHGGNVSLGENAYRMDPAAIHRQYLRDMAVASDNGLLADDEFEKLKSTLEVRLERRTLEREWHRSSNRLGMFFGRIARSPAFGRREKARMLAAALAPRSWR